MQNQSSTVHELVSGGLFFLLGAIVGAILFLRLKMVLSTKCGVTRAELGFISKNKKRSSNEIPLELTIRFGVTLQFNLSSF